MYCFLSTPFIGAVPWPGEMLQHTQKGKNAQLHTHTQKGISTLILDAVPWPGEMLEHTHLSERELCMHTQKVSREEVEHVISHHRCSILALGNVATHILLKPLQF